MATTVQLSLRKKILFSLFIFAVVCAIGEVGARFYMRRAMGYSGGPLLQYEFDPYKNITPTRNFVDTRGLKHNAQGFRRSTDVALAKPAGTFRIFLMGGSTAYGTGGLWPHIERRYPVLKNSETVDAYLELELNERIPGRRFEVINAAMPSIWTHHHLIYLNQTILKYNPDMVILLDGYNDFYQYGRNHDQFNSYAYQEHSHVIMGPPTMGSLLYSNMWWLGRKSAMVHVSLRELRKLKALFARPERPPMDVTESMAGLREVFPKNALSMIDRIALLLQHENVAAAFVLQPMLIMERDRAGMTEIEKKMFEFNLKSYLPNYEQYMQQAVPFVRELEKTTVEKYGATFLDATPIFKQVPGQVYTDYAHLTPAANQVLANFIVDGITSAIQRKSVVAATAPDNATQQRVASAQR